MRRSEFAGAAAIAAAIAGAGFASGREIVAFFARFGVAGYVGAALAAGLIGWMARETALIAARTGTASFPGLMRLCAGRAWGSGVLMWLMSIAVSAAMTAAGGELCALAINIHGARQIGMVCTAALAALCAAIVQRVLRPQKPQMPVPDPSARLNLLRARVQKTPAMLAEEKQRRLAAAICGAVCALCAVPAALYLLNIANFTSWELESVMGAMLLNVGPWLVVRAQVCYKSISREAEAASQAPKLAQPLPKKPTNAGKGRMILRGVLYIAATALIVCGIANGGMRDVLVKAINICTECIGLG